MSMCEEMEKLWEEGRAEGRTEGRTEGRAEGRAEGIAEVKREMAMNLLKDGELPVEKIAAALGLSVDEIEEIKKNI